MSDGSGHTILTYTFTQPVTVGSGGASIAIDFNLNGWVIVDGSTVPSVGEGSTLNITDPSRYVTSRTVGFVLNLQASSFVLKHGNHNLTVLMGPGTQVLGGTLKNNQHVFVYAVWNQTAKTLIASKIQIK